PHDADPEGEVVVRGAGDAARAALVAGHGGDHAHPELSLAAVVPGDARAGCHDGAARLDRQVIVDGSGQLGESDRDALLGELHRTPRKSGLITVLRRGAAVTEATQLSTAQMPVRPCSMSSKPSSIATDTPCR